MKRFCYPLVLFFIYFFPQFALGDNVEECKSSVVSLIPVKDLPKREKMLKERGGVHCQFADRDSFMANMIRNKHINKMTIMQMAESGS